MAAGAYGKVILSRKKNTNDLFAIKVLEIAKMKEKMCVETIMNEKAILSGLNTDFITRGVYTFKSKKYLYMVMEFMKGGDFGHLLEEYGYFEEQYAKFYIAELVLALEQLHSAGVIHRDLKPDNMLLDAYGHMKLTDFGLSEAGLQNQNLYKEFIDKIDNDSEVCQQIEDAQRINSIDRLSKGEEDDNIFELELNNSNIKDLKKAPTMMADGLNFAFSKKN